MQNYTLLLCSKVSDSRRWRLVPLVILALLAFHGALLAQPLAGTYTVGGAAPNYATIDAAITDLNARGVSAPVTFAIRSGTYTPPAAGYVLSNVPSMTAANTVTFRPDANAVVTIDGSLSIAIMDFNGARYFIIDGWGGSGVLKRDMKIIQRSSGTVMRFINGAQFNTVRNCNLISNASGSTTGTIAFLTTATVGNSYNKIVNNTIGDSTGTLRTSCGIYMSGSTTRNARNVLDSNDMLNMGYSGLYIYGFYISGNNDSTLITHNRIRTPNINNTGSVYPLYGVYYSNSTATYDTIAYNQFWDLKSQYTSATVYGVYVTTAGTSPIAIHHNMFSFNGDAAAGVYGVYIATSSTTNFTVDYNSIELSGTIPTSSSSGCVYMTSTANVTMRNNILSNLRPTTGSILSYCIYRSSATGTFTSNNNLVYNVGTGTNMGYYNGTNYAALSNWQPGTGKDAASRTGNPRFVNSAIGDLHVSTTQRTAVESNGTPIAGLTTDFDGNAHNAVTPDIGADEGTFLPLLANDMAADKFLNPVGNQTVISNTSFTPTAVATNAGLNNLLNVPVRYRIINASSVVVYSDIQTIATINSGVSQVLTFNATGNQSGSTSLAAGTYTIELTTQLAGDLDVTSDVITGTITVKDPLNGIYTIDKFGAGPRNYTSFTAALADMNFVGVNAPVTFNIASGTYDNTTETFPITLKVAPGVSATNTVTFRPAPGATVTVTGASPVSSSIFLIEGGKYYTFDGSNVVGGTTKNWTIRNTEATTSSTFWLRNDADRNTIKNCIVQGNANASVKYISSTTQSGAIVFIGQTTAATGNDSNLVQNCTIGDPAGTYRNNVAACVFGTSGKPNNGNRIVGNDVLNFGNAGTYGYGLEAYGEQAGTEFRNNLVHMTVAAPAAITTLYGYYTDYSPGYPINTVFDGNKIYKLTSAAANWTVYGVYHWVSTSNSNSLFSNNMFSLAETGDHTYYGIYFASSTGNTNLYHNTFYFGGASTGTRSVYMLYKSSANTIASRNNIYMSSRSGGSASNYGLYLSSSGGWTSNNNVISFNTSSNYYTAYYTSAQTTLANYQGTSGQDAASYGVSVSMIDPINGDLHVNPQPVFQGEGTAVTGLGIATDFDAQTRDVLNPDMGADEGDFNGGGIHVVTPNGGEKYSVDFNLDVVFTSNRPLPIRVDMSTDAGATWTTKATANATTGTNTVTITTPTNLTTLGRVRVMSTKNAWEGDSSDANFELVLPVFAVTAPNGGETLVPTDTTQLTWSSQFAPPTMRLELDYSTDGGSNWTVINNNVYTTNLPAMNTYPWIIPNSPTAQGKVRIKVFGGNINDASDNNFTITPQPSVLLLHPNGGEQLYIGGMDTVRWTSQMTTSVKLDYSTDGGGTWNDVVPFGQTLPAYVNSFPWKVPNTPSTTALVRVTNVERPRFRDTSNAMLSIVNSFVQVLSPNGGEKYELETPINLTWTSAYTNTLRLDFSFDGGANWQTIAGNLPAASGSYSFIPPPVPTKLALVRLVNVQHPEFHDESNATFELLPGASITVYTPAAGDMLVRNSTTQITWDAPRITSVNIMYSLTGGAPWTTIATNVTASEGSRGWTVPNQLTTQGKIRIQDAGGPLFGESGQFSIVDQAVPSVHVTLPNGGEKYNQGDTVYVRWSATNIPTVNVWFNDGKAWHIIQAGVQGNAAVIPWIITSAPGTNYRVRVVATTGSPADTSDAPFEVVAHQQSHIALLYPNGGENLTVASTAKIRWNAAGVLGNVKLDWSSDSGATWTQLADVPASDGTWDWTVPNTLTKVALVRVMKPNTAPSVGDTSDAVFEITKETVAQLRVLSPNGGEVWSGNQVDTIVWEVTPGIANIDIKYYDGVLWHDVANSVPMSLGKYAWTVPLLPTTTTSAVVKILNSADSSQNDLSDGPFTIVPVTLGVNLAVTGLEGLRTLGVYPNPNTGVTELRWAQPKSGEVEVRLYQAQGGRVGTFSAGNRNAGEQRYLLNAPELVSGVYLWEVRIAGGVARGVMTVVK